ncbi:hypothetical protein ACFWQJ_02825 [Kocuria palustris]|uniref:hypothetical protein n=1 Tax=Kocuria palustris TaxID=71999 RepID=UPI00364DC66C
MPTAFMDAKTRLLEQADLMGLSLSNRKLDRAAKKLLLLDAGRHIGNGESTTLTYADPTPAEAIRNILRESAR